MRIYTTDLHADTQFHTNKNQVARKYTNTQEKDKKNIMLNGF